MKSKILDTVSSSDKGFTLLEVLIAIVLVGLAVVALMLSNQSLTNVNAAGLDLSTAEFLTEEMREKTMSISFENLPAAAGVFSPPIDVNGAVLDNYSTYSQQVTIENVSGADFTTPQAGSDFVRVTVDILNNGRTVSSTSWIRVKL